MTILPNSSGRDGAWFGDNFLLLSNFSGCRLPLDLLRFERPQGIQIAAQSRRRFAVAH
jgi:hypothetical protein